MGRKWDTKIQRFYFETTTHLAHILAFKMFGPGGWPVYEVKCLSMFQRVVTREGGRVANPTIFLMFDSYDMNALEVNLVMTSSLASKWQVLSWDAHFSVVL